MRILLTGHRGYLGSHIHRFLLLEYRDAEVIVLEEDKSSMEAYRESIVFGEVSAHNYTHIIHVGAASSTTVSCQDAFDWNYRATQCLSELIELDPSAHFIFFSSCAANDPVTTPYGFSKRAASDWLFNNRKNVCVFIPYNIFGCEVGRQKKFSIPENIVRRQVDYVTKPFIRDYIHIQDCLRMVKKGIDESACGVFQMGTGVGYEFDELCEIGNIDISELPCIRPGHEKYPIVGEASRVAVSPFMETKICVRDWIKSHLSNENEKVISESFMNEDGIKVVMVDGKEIPVPLGSWDTLHS